MYLIFDTETTGFPQKSLPADHPDQARIVQLACVLLDDKFEERAVFCTLIKPDGWRIASHVTAVHGITTDDCDTFGVPIKTALAAMMSLAENTELIIAHNIKFDKQMLEIELGCCMMTRYTLPDYCTMMATTPICKLPGKYDGYKWPKLKEAYEILFPGEKLEGAHDALVDVRACARIFKHLRSPKPESDLLVPA